MSQGWISLHRKIQENWLYPTNEKRDFSKYEAWLDILLMVNHEPKKIMFNEKLIEVEKGQRVTSIKALSERWGWSRKKVSNFLNLLEKEHQICQKRTSRMTLITVVNYELYQHRDIKKEQKEHQESKKGTSKEHQKNTNNNDNNDNKTSSHKFETCDMENAQYLFSLMQENNPDVKQPNFEKWANDFRLMRERDKRTDKQIKYLIKWSQQDEFWRNNILSPAKLRKQFDALVVRVKTEKGKKSNSPPTNNIREMEDI